MKITVVGAGNVGATCADVLAYREIANEVVVVDIKEGLAERSLKKGKSDEAEESKEEATDAVKEVTEEVPTKAKPKTRTRKAKAE